MGEVDVMYCSLGAIHIIRYIGSGGDDEKR